MSGHRRLPGLPEPEKPIAEMTVDERAAYTAQLRRALRDDQVRRDRRPPRSTREVEIGAVGVRGAGLPP